MTAAALSGIPANAAGLPSALETAAGTVRSVGPEGRGHEAAAAAWSVLAGAPVAAVPGLLAAMDGANDYALNWLRSAVETVVQRGAASGQVVALADLEAFVGDTGHHPRARRMAFELLQGQDPVRASVLLDQFLNDPGTEMRRDAVARLAGRAAALAESGDTAGAVASFRRALAAAREADQVDELAQKLRGLGEPVDLRETFGWVTRWKVIGPFDNSGGGGFSSSFPPEESVDLAAEHGGKGVRVRWQDYETLDEYGLVDFNRPLSPLKEVTGYAWTEFWSETGRPAQIRLGCKNGWKVWVNGQFLFGRDEYHRAAEMDQYRLPFELRPGRNTILVKCCQNEQTEDWTREWEFQLRVTDAEGTPIRSSK
ncbi:MAG: hypothetical protein KF791_02865 [Verrucomicrobiae bacterium]|nr:hypothetical protein [Verrucomicrobiae bacterium]